MITQDERWNLRYQEVMDFITANHRNPSRHRLAEHDMLNWLKANRKVMNKGEMKEERVERFRELMEMMEKFNSRISKYAELMKRMVQKYEKTYFMHWKSFFFITFAPKVR